MRSISWWLVLAAFGCETRPSAGGARDTGSADVQRVARVKERDHGVPCATYGVGSEVRYGDFALRFERPILAAPEVRSPWVESETERVSLRSARVLIVPLALRNVARVPKSPPHRFFAITRDGAVHPTWTENERLWSERHDRRVYAELGQVDPDEIVRTAFVFDVDPALRDGIVLYMQRTGSVRDRSGQTREVVYEHAVVDLLASVDGEPIRGDHGTSRQ